MYLLRLKELRESRGLTQTELAQLMQVVPRQYQRYERGEQEPRLAGWIFLADLYDVSLDYLRSHPIWSLRSRERRTCP